MPLSSNRRLDPGTVTILDSVETDLTELDNGSSGNIEYALVDNEGAIDTQWAFTEAKEFPLNVGGRDLVDTLTFESLDEDGGYRQFRVKGEFVDIDEGIISGIAEVDFNSIGIFVNGVQVGGSEKVEGEIQAHTLNFDAVITVKDGDFLQFPHQHVASADGEVDVTYEVDEAAIIIS
jgi:hypothetical protein